MINSGLYGDMSILQPIADNAGQILLFQMLMFWSVMLFVLSQLARELTILLFQLYVALCLHGCLVTQIQGHACHAQFIDRSVSK